MSHEQRLEARRVLLDELIELTCCSLHDDCDPLADPDRGYEADPEGRPGYRLDTTTGEPVYSAAWL